MTIEIINIIADAVAIICYVVLAILLIKESEQ